MAQTSGTRRGTAARLSVCIQKNAGYMRILQAATAMEVVELCKSIAELLEDGRSGRKERA